MSYTRKIGIDERKHSLRQRNNAYVLYVLNQFIEEKFAEIEEASVTFSLTAEQVEEVQNAFLAILGEINFNTAYIKKLFKRAGEDSSDIHYDSFKAYIYHIDSSLKAMENFVDDIFEFKRKQFAALESQLFVIKHAINLYTGANKQAFIKEFNRDFELLLTGLQRQINQGAAVNARAGAQNLLNSLQNKETSYYEQFSLFATRRKAHSSLQPRIDAAEKHLSLIKP